MPSETPKVLLNDQQYFLRTISSGWYGIPITNLGALYTQYTVYSMLYTSCSAVQLIKGQTYFPYTLKISSNLNIISNVKPHLEWQDLNKKLKSLQPDCTFKRS